MRGVPVLVCAVALLLGGTGCEPDDVATLVNDTGAHVVVVFTDAAGGKAQVADLGPGEQAATHLSGATCERRDYQALADDGSVVARRSALCPGDTWHLGK